MEPAHLRRHGQRGTYDTESVKSVFEDCYMAHVSYIDNGLPACLPMIALVKAEEELEANMDANSSEDSDRSSTKSNNIAVYLHGHPSSRLMELVRKADEQSIGENNSEAQNQERNQVKEPVKVCITATKGNYVLFAINHII
jgi:nitroimidazol reductase NimA-like FMN-containing flavoprotein (pyridoxamine 5'-phosphate oxidase superfamily)